MAFGTFNDPVGIVLKSALAFNPYPPLCLTMFKAKDGVKLE